MSFHESAGHSYEFYASLCRVLRVILEYPMIYIRVYVYKYSGVTQHQCDQAIRVPSLDVISFGLVASGFYMNKQQKQPLVYTVFLLFSIAISQCCRFIWCSMDPGVMKKCGWVEVYT